MRRSAIQCLSWKGYSVGGQQTSVCDTDEQTHVKIKLYQNLMGTSIDPEQLIAARKVGATLEELHQCVDAGEIPPVRLMDLLILQR